MICSSWNRTRPEADRPTPSCQSCGPLSSPAPDNKFAVDYSVAAVTGQQLFFADLPVSERTRRATAAARPPAPPERALTAVTTPPPTPIHDGAQQLLCDPPHEKLPIGGHETAR